MTSCPNISQENIRPIPPLFAPKTQKFLSCALAIITGLAALTALGLGLTQGWWFTHTLSQIHQLFPTISLVALGTGCGTFLILCTICTKDAQSDKRQCSLYPSSSKNQYNREAVPPPYLHPLLHKNDNLEHYFTSLQLEEYTRDFNSTPEKFDIYEIHFQNFAIRITNFMEKNAFNRLRTMDTSKNEPALERLYRARTYAISCRDDIGWCGEQLENEQDKENKKTTIQEHQNSLTLYSWSLASQEGISKENISFPSIMFGISPLTTTDHVLAVCEANPGKKVGWLSMANAHNVGGGSQEELTASDCDGAALLGLHGGVAETNWYNLRQKYYRGQNHIVYEDGWHIPPGGNYCAKTCFFGNLQPGSENKPVDAYMIATAFADFRHDFPGEKLFLNQHGSERSDYFTIFGQEHNPEELKMRLKLDMQGVCKTALVEGITILVLGASGCGAFKHDPKLEAKLWKEVLDEFSGCFEEVHFAIATNNTSKDPNYRAFENQFVPEQNL